MESKTVMASHEVDAGVRATAAPFVEIAAAAEPRGKLGQDAGLAFPEFANAVAVLSVPFAPQDREISDLVSARAKVPRLGDQFYLGNHGVLMDDIEKCAQLVYVVKFAREGAR